MNRDIYSDNDKLSEMNPSLIRAIENQQRLLQRQNNPYNKGMTLEIPDEHSDDYLSEYNKLSNDENVDPLLMYILQKNAQSGFKNGPIGSDGYYESFDPELNPQLKEDYQQFLNSFYPNR